MAKVLVSEDNLSLQRINEKCINCGACLKTCTELNHLAKNDCVNCGQCILTCPMGALVPKYNYKEVLANIHDEEKIVVVSIAPAVRVSIGDEFGFAPGEFLEKKVVGALKTLGFDYVFDITYGADVTIMEEASELISRIQNKGILPMYTSCCSSWVNYMEKYYPKDLGHLSTCKSPIGMQGAIIKNYFATLKNLNAKDIVTVTIAPCVSKKTEIKKGNNDDNDYILTTSELAYLIREQGINLKTVEEKEFDSLLGKGSGAGLIFGTSGGVTEAVLRTAYFLLNLEKAPENFFQLECVRGKENLKEAEVNLGSIKLHVAVIIGLHTVKNIYSSLSKYQFIEVMTCPHGCIGGGGQPILPKQKEETYIDERCKNLYKEDKQIKKRSSYENKEVKELYKNFLDAPLSEKAKKLLHTTHKDKAHTLKVIN